MQNDIYLHSATSHEGFSQIYLLLISSTGLIAGRSKIRVISGGLHTRVVERGT